MKNTLITGIILLFLGFTTWQFSRTPPPGPVEAKKQKLPNQHDEMEQELELIRKSVNQTQIETSHFDKKTTNDVDSIAYYQQLNFSEFFLKQLKQLENDSEQAKLVRKESLFLKVSELEEEDYLMADQGQFLKLAVLRKVLTGSKLDAAVEQLKAEYQERSRLLIMTHAVESDPLLEKYKRQEREIVRDVLALSSYPEGLTREQYLRKRLDAARKAIYGE